MIRNVLRIRFPIFCPKRIHQNCKSVKRYLLWATSNKALPIMTYLSLSFFNFIYIVHAQAKAVQKDDQELTLQAAITQADELFKMGKFQESFNTLKAFKGTDNVEVIWRIARALFNMSKAKDISKSKLQELVLEAYQEIERALKLDDEHYAVHKWMAILHDAKSELEGAKARIKALPIFKEHLMKSLELNPKDATTIYMLGQYMYNLADLSWLQRSIAAAFLGNPPEGSFEEAFQYFTKAEEVEPNFYSANLLMLGKTCLKLKKLEAAHFWLKCASAYPVRTDEDEAVRIEAQNLLNSYSLAGNAKKTESQENIQ